MRFRMSALTMIGASCLLAGCTSTYSPHDKTVVVDPSDGGYTHSQPQPTYAPPGKAKKQKKSKARGGPPPWAPAHGYRAKHSYQYYPAAEVYYEPARGTYFWYESGGWKVGVRLPDHITLHGDGTVVLDMDDDKPYRYHDDVRAMYGGHR